MPARWPHTGPCYDAVLLYLLNRGIWLVKLRLVRATNTVRIPLMKEVYPGSDSTPARILRIDGCLSSPPFFLTSRRAYVVEILRLARFFLPTWRSFHVLLLLQDDFFVDWGGDQGPVHWGQSSESMFIRKAGWSSLHFGHQRL